jgi:hypothetical protein
MTGLLQVEEIKGLVRRVGAMGAWLALCLNAAVLGQDFSYQTVKGAISITGYTGPGGTVSIPSTIDGLPVVSIASYAFSSNSSLTNVIIADSVTNLAGDAFSYCSNLGSVTLGNGVITIGSTAFASCTGLTSLAIPESVTTIANGARGLFETIGAFSSCTNLVTLTFGHGLTNIGDFAFSYCANLTNVVVPDGLLRIGEDAFAHCTSLTNILISKSVTDIPTTSVGFVPGLLNGPFFGCSSLLSITVDPDNRVYSSLEGVLFNKNQTTLIVYPGGKQGSYTIPGSVTSFGFAPFGGCVNLTQAILPESITDLPGFSSCTSLTNVIMGNSITNIGSFAFAYCSSLTNIMIPRSVTNIEDYAFYACSNLQGIYFAGNAPGTFFCNCYTAYGIVYYLPGTTGWASTFAGHPAVLWDPLPQTGDGSFGVRLNTFGFNIKGTADIPLMIEASTDVAGRSWIPLHSCTLTNGLIYFNDPQWTNYPIRFYRIRSP